MTKQHSADLGMPLAGVLPVLRPAVEALGLSVAETEGGVSVDLADGRLRLAARGDRCTVTLEAGDAARLAELRESIGYYFGEQAPRLDWAADREPGRPSNLTMARVAANDRLSPSFRRLRLAGDFSRFGREGLHFRLLFGPVGADWPSTDASGATRWPGGMEAWHRPPYTIRAIAPDFGWIDVDIVLHAGGRVTGWAARAQPGDHVALTGPGGKVPRIARWVGYVGDETALPVIARMLEVLPEGTRGAARIFVPDAGDAQPVPCPPGVDLRWMVHGRDGTPLDALRALAPPEAGRFVFFAGERRAAEAARAHLDASGLGRGDFHAAAYWTEGWTPPPGQVRDLARREGGATGR